MSALCLRSSLASFLVIFLLLVFFHEIESMATTRRVQNKLVMIPITGTSQCLEKMSSKRTRDTVCCSSSASRNQKHSVPVFASAKREISIRIRVILYRVS